MEDTVGNVEKIVRDDIITDEEDADNIINVSSKWLFSHDFSLSPCSRILVLPS